MSLLTLLAPSTAIQDMGFFLQEYIPPPPGMDEACQPFGVVSCCLHQSPQQMAEAPFCVVMKVMYAKWNSLMALGKDLLMEGGTSYEPFGYRTLAIQAFS